MIPEMRMMQLPINRGSSFKDYLGRRLMASRHPVQMTGEFIREWTATAEERRLLTQVRQGSSACWRPDDEPHPLVTVRIATYDRGPIVAERSLASAIRQTYERLEILVIGDHCDGGHRRSRPVGPGSKNSICKPSGSR